MNNSRSNLARPILYLFFGMALLLLAYPILHAADQPPAVGSAAPDFKLTSQEGTQVSLRDFRGKWVVLYFYPKDFTTGCTIEAHNFQRDLAQYEQKNTVILGVSVDTVDSHKEFCTKEGLSFKLLADSDKQVVNTYGSTQTFNGNVVAARNTFIINPQGVIVKEYIKVDPTKHSEELLAALPSLQQAGK
ncbi:MAG: peroxiredoxin [Acidobacteriia bacterium]|nr:peroxiredoxin [Terriglobia bacterium]